MGLARLPEARETVQQVVIRPNSVTWPGDEPQPHKYLESRALEPMTGQWSIVATIMVAVTAYPKQKVVFKVDNCWIAFPTQSALPRYCDRQRSPAGGRQLLAWNRSASGKRVFTATLRPGVVPKMSDQGLRSLRTGTASAVNNHAEKMV